MNTLLQYFRIALFLVSASLPVCVYAQGGGRGGAAPANPKAAAPIDLTGYWVSIINEEWKWRMVTPAKGDYASLPITMEAKAVADAWDPAKDEAAGEQCKSYGAAAIMRLPGRLHVTWQDDNTLRMDLDAGTQTRVFHFGNWKSPGGEATWQGESVAQWEMPRAAAPAAGGGGSGDLKVSTTNMKAGYLRKNGVPYSEKATMTEYYDVVQEHDGKMWLVVTSVVTDPRYLAQPLILSTHFRKQADAAGWDPTPCSSTW